MQHTIHRTLWDYICDFIVTIAWLVGLFIWGATIWGIISGLMG